MWYHNQLVDKPLVSRNLGINGMHNLMSGALNATKLWCVLENLLG